MPLHREILAEGRPVEIGRDGGSVPDAEARQIYQGDLKTAFLQPVHVGREVEAVISLADRRGPDRICLDDADRRFVTAVAGAISVALRLHESPWGALDHVDRTIDRERETRFSLTRQIRSSLFGILGSVETLRRRGNDDPELNRLVGIIDRSARRLEECVSADGAEIVLSGETADR
jgi:hypothetical protein